MLKLTRISTENGKGMLEAFLKERMKTKGGMPVFFYSPHCLMTWLTHMGKTLYIAEYQLGAEDTDLRQSQQDKEMALIVHKEQYNDIRFLFDEPSEQMIASVTKHFNPQYIAVNELLLPPDTEFFFDERKVMTAVDSRTGLSYIGNNELSIDVAQVAEVSDIDLASDYRKYMRKHGGQLEVQRYEEGKHFDLVKAFMKEWSNSRTEEQNKFAKTENDIRFMELFGRDQDVVGTLIVDKVEGVHKVVAVSFFVPALDGNAIGVISKTLRGYKQLGVGLAVERAKAMAACGYATMHIGNINNEFKKRFIPCGKKVQVYSRVIYCKPDFEVGIRYLLMVF